MMNFNSEKIIYSLIVTYSLNILFQNNSLAKDFISKEKYLSSTLEINLTLKNTKDLNEIKTIIKEKMPKIIYIEQWMLLEKGNENLLKKLYKITKKNDIKLLLFIGRNSWIGKRGVVNALTSIEQYGDSIDGIVLRTQPDKLNIWDKNDIRVQAEILNQMLDAYSAINIELKKRNKSFVAEFPFWYSDYKGPTKNFSQNVCDFADKIIFLIDDTSKLEDLNIKWNDVPCRYSIDLTKKALGQTLEDPDDIYKVIKSKLVFYQNFSSYIIDSDYRLNEEL